MKKTTNLLMLAGVICSNFLIGQTLTSAWSPTTTSISTDQTADTAGIVQGTGGSGMVWDYSGLVAQGAASTTNWASPVGTTYAAQFPSANLSATETGTGNFVSYYKTDATGFYILGDGSTTSTTIYSDPMKYFGFPMAYTDTCTDAYKGVTIMGTYTIKSTGSITSTLDGTGQLKLPSNHTFNNVVRLHVVQQTVDSSYSGTFSNVNTYSNDSYIWVSSSVCGQTLLVVGYSINGGSKTKSVQYYPGSATGIEEQAFETGVSIYPNPSKGVFTITLKKVPSKASIEITNVLGEAVYTSSIQDSSTSINLEGAPKGIYLYRLQGDNKLLKTGKIVVE